MNPGTARTRALTFVLGGLGVSGLWEALPRSLPAASAQPACVQPAVARPAHGGALAVVRCDGDGATPNGAQWLLCGHPMDLNAATAEDLTALPGVGPKTALRIVTHRDTHGAFPSVAALDGVHGVGPRTVARLAPLLTVSR